MKRAVPLLIALFVSFTVVRAQSDRVRQKAIVLKKMIERNHYSPRTVDDSFSVSLFKAILNLTDPRRLFFTEAEYKQLTTYAFQLDDEHRGNCWAFFES